MTRTLLRSAMMTALLGCTCLAAWSSAADAQTPAATATLSITVAAQDLSGALLALGRQTGRVISFAPTTVAGKRSNAVQAAPSFEAALQQMLAGTGLQFSIAPDGSASVVQRTSALAPQIVPSRAALRANEPQPEELTVTGSRIRGAAPVGSELIRIDRLDIERQGFATTTDVIRSLPQNNALGPTDVSTVLFGNVDNQQNTSTNTGRGSAVNLRGLGSNATLVLVNGRRVAPAAGGAFFDISAVPLSAIERIEVLPDGASAIYGSDAIGGVVNVILRRDFEGAETSLRYTTMDGGGQRRQASQIIGTSWDSGNAVLTYQYSRRNALRATERDYARQDLRALGGGNYGFTYANPGTISAGGRTYPIPAGQNGRNLQASSLVAGPANMQDYLLLDYEILPTETTHAAYLHLSQDVGNRLNLFGDVNFNNRMTRVVTYPYRTIVTVPRSNPFFVSPIPGATSVSVMYNFYHELGSTVSYNTDASYSASFGATYSLPGDWQAEVVGLMSKDMIGASLTGYPNSQALARALADTNPATALNVFGDGSNNNPETSRKLAAHYASDQSYLYRGGQFKVDGPLFGLPAGAVRVAAGVDGRQERSHAVTRNSVSTEDVRQAPATDLSREVVAAFAELFVPVFSEQNALPGLRRLDLSFAVRSEHYTGFGYTTNPKLGISWSPIDSLTLRGSYGHSFKAPLLTETNIAGNIVNILTLSDPKSPTGTTPALLLQGGRADLKPERAKTWSAGADFRPAEIPGLSLDATYFKIDYTDRIGSITLSTALALDTQNGSTVRRNPPLAEINALLADPTFTGATMPASSIGAIIDIRRSNLAKQLTQGLDLHGSYSFPAFGGTLGVESGATILFKNLTAVTAQTPLGSTLNGLNIPTKYRVRSGVNFSHDGGSINLFMNYVNAYNNKTVTPVQRIGRWTTFDMSLAYDFQGPRYPGWLQNTKVSLTVFNLADLDPPFVNVTGGYDPVNATPYGRQVALFLTKRW